MNPLEIAAHARRENIPEVPKKVRSKAKLFGKGYIEQFYARYYERESRERIPFYLPYLYMRNHFDYLRHYGNIPRNQISLVLIDDGDERTDYFLYEFLGELNFLTIVTERKEYFACLQDRVFGQLGLILELVRPWEAKNLPGNLVWDFTSRLQPSQCYPKNSICFMPHKKEWKIKEQLSCGNHLTVVSVKCVEIAGETISPSLAESMLVPKRFPFRESRCKELYRWSKEEGWKVKLRARTLEKP